jgi:hypothetical protein
MKSSSFLMRQRLNAKDFRTILAEDDTEYFGGYQGKNNARFGSKGYSSRISDG